MGGAETVLEARRREAGLTREQLAVAAGVTAKTIYSIEHGHSRPQRTTLQAIARALGCSPEDLDEQRIPA